MRDNTYPGRNIINRIAFQGERGGIYNKSFDRVFGRREDRINRKQMEYVECARLFIMEPQV